MQAMQRLEGLMRKAMQMYDMVKAGDKICVGVSGGKDSVALTVALMRLSRYYGVPYTIHALTLDPCFNSKQTDYTELSIFFKSEGIAHTVTRTNIGSIVFDIRKEKNPCSLCAMLRRGALHSGAQQLGCNKVALGHHLDDAIETFYMNLFGAGHIDCFSPKTWLSQRSISILRPMVLAEEQDIIRAVRSMNLPVVKSLCPVDGETARAKAKIFVNERAKIDSAFRKKTLHAMQESNVGSWAPTCKTTNVL